MLTQGLGGLKEHLLECSQNNAERSHKGRYCLWGGHYPCADCLAGEKAGGHCDLDIRNPEEESSLCSHTHKTGTQAPGCGLGKSHIAALSAARANSGGEVAVSSFCLLGPSQGLAGYNIHPAPYLQEHWRDLDNNFPNSSGWIRVEWRLRIHVSTT